MRNSEPRRVAGRYARRGELYPRGAAQRRSVPQANPGATPFQLPCRLERSGLRPRPPRACYPLVEWQPSAERNSSRGEPSTSCKSFIAKGTDSSSIAGRIGHFLQVAPIESAAARIIFRLARISARGTPDRTLTTYGELSGQIVPSSQVRVAFPWMP